MCVISAVCRDATMLDLMTPMTLRFLGYFLWPHKDNVISAETNLGTTCKSYVGAKVTGCGATPRFCPLERARHPLIGPPLAILMPHPLVYSNRGLSLSEPVLILYLNFVLVRSNS